MTILVTGATGTIGNKVVLALAEHGKDVRAAVRNVERAAALKDEGAQVAEFDYDNPALMKDALIGVDRMFMMTPFVEDQAAALEKMLEAAKAAKVRFILRLSGLGADSNSPMMLAKQHGIAENMIKHSGIDHAFIRPNFFMDNLINYQGDTIRKDGAFYGAAGGGKIAYISSRDVAAVCYAILTKPQEHAGQAYDISGPHAYSEAEVAELISKATGKTVKYVDLPSDQLKAGLESNGLPPWMIQGMLELETVKANGWSAGTTAHVREITGHEGETFEQFLEKDKARFS